MRHISLILLCILFLCSSYSYSQPLLLSQGTDGRKPALQNADSAKPAAACMQKAEQLLNEAFTFIRKNYYRKDLVQWQDLLTTARDKLRISGNCDDVYETISWCFQQLNEGHSFIMPPAKAAIYNNELPDDAPPPPLSDLVGEIKGEWLQDSIAYLTIPWVSTSDSLICMHIADSLQDLIAKLDRPGISRWIVDLRRNTGGNCWPMLAGIGPLLGEGIYGYFVRDDEKVPFSYHDGGIFQGRHMRCKVSNPNYRPRNDHRSIVVLTGRKTISAGEIVALAFKGRQQICLYGEPTGGLTTVNATYPLSDRSMLVLSVCQEADHTGRICEGSIAPDKYITAADGQPQADLVKNAAIRWLQSQ